MARKRYLRERQLGVLDDLFGGELDEQAVLKKHGVSRAVYNKWLGNELFASEFSRRLGVARLQGELIIARYSAVAAAKLVQLTESAKEETARRACLDIISLPRRADKKTAVLDKPRAVNTDKAGQAPHLSEAVAGRLLAALAKEKSEKLKVEG